MHPEISRLLLPAAFALREPALGAIERLLPAPESALLAGILLGAEQGLPAELQQAFKASGTSHLIAISGFNVAVVVSVFATLFLRMLDAQQRSTRRNGSGSRARRWYC